ncbi:MAG TPA: nuclear transport factor 2 family protein [Candidatus Limnocylindria bacterium]|nr:nuclear transport factor 2 family protein [Candidatus Limnocylindria bacterium]
MNRSDVQAWLDRYIEAWRANDAAPIKALFADDAEYRYRPYGDDDVCRGPEAIAASWLKNPDDPVSWEAEYEPFAVDGDRAVAIGWSRYAASDTEPERTYRNAYLLVFGPDGRCRRFTEYFMLEQ